MRILSKFLVLSWKNLLLKKRHWFMTCMEVVLPIVLFALIAVLRSQITATNSGGDGDIGDEANTFYPSDLQQMFSDNRWLICDGSRRLYYTGPQEEKNHLDTIMERVHGYLNYSCSGYDITPGNLQTILMSIILNKAPDTYSQCVKLISNLRNDVG